MRANLLFEDFMPHDFINKLRNLGVEAQPDTLYRRAIDLLGTFGINPGSHGFFGTPISKATRPAIGAHVSLNTL